MISLKLPWPPTVNHYYVRRNNRMFISKRGRVFRAEVRIESLIAGIRQPLEGYLQMAIKLYPPDRHVRDMDNILKALWDALQHAGVYKNDSQIKKLVMEDTFEMGGFIEIDLQPITVSCET